MQGSLRNLTDHKPQKYQLLHCTASSVILTISSDSKMMRLGVFHFVAATLFLIATLQTTNAFDVVAPHRTTYKFVS